MQVVVTLYDENNYPAEVNHMGVVLKGTSYEGKN